MKKITLFIILAFSVLDIAQQKNIIFINSIAREIALHKKNVHASYYHDKFNGRKTASGRKFSNNDLTAAHMKFPFGTLLRVTNEANKKSAIVEVTDGVHLLKEEKLISAREPL